MSDEDAEDLLSVLRAVLVYDPKERPTASQLLQYDWFQRTKHRLQEYL